MTLQYSHGVLTEFLRSIPPSTQSLNLSPSTAPKKQLSKLDDHFFQRSEMFLHRCIIPVHGQDTGMCGTDFTPPFNIRYMLIFRDTIQGNKGVNSKFGRVAPFC